MCFCNELDGYHAGLGDSSGIVINYHMLPYNNVTNKSDLCLSEKGKTVDAQKTSRYVAIFSLT